MGIDNCVSVCVCVVVVIKLDLGAVINIQRVTVSSFVRCSPPKAFSSLGDKDCADRAFLQ